MTEREPWSDEEVAALQAEPYNYILFNAKFPEKRTKKAFQIKREMLGITRAAPLVPKQFVPPEAKVGTTIHSPVFWDKPLVKSTWRDYIEPMAALQDTVAARTREQTHATLSIPSDNPVAIAFISDWHIGSWGVDAREIARYTDRLLSLSATRPFYVAILGDMLEMAIRLRSVLEINGNLLPAAEQLDFMESWLSEMAPIVLFGTWDNHSVQREEELVGHSRYASIFQGSTIYFSGIGHADITIGDQVYTLAVSHRFRGRSRSNPVAGQVRYITECPDREVVVGGDSHIPGALQYVYNDRVRTVANCGTLQNNLYTRRNFSLTTSACMPVLVFNHERHIVTSHLSLDDYEAVYGG